MDSGADGDTAVAACYDERRAAAYARWYRGNWARRLSSWREVSLARRALRSAGDPDSVLDMPCGTGRFWPMLAATPARRLLAGDASPAMLATARAVTAPAVLARFEIGPMNAFALPLGDASVAHILCMRLLHHFADSRDRLRVLRELHRVARDSVTLSLWVDGNLQARRRRRREAGCGAGHPPNRVIVPRRVIEAEFAAVGFRVRRRFDQLPGIGKRRLYLLDKG